MKQAIKIGKMLRVLDEKGNLSLTNLAVMAAIINLAMRKDVVINDMLIFLASIVGYQVKRFAKNPNDETEATIEELNAAIAKVESKVTAMQMGNSLKPK